MKKSGLVGRMAVINADNTFVKAIHFIDGSHGDFPPFLQ